MNPVAIALISAILQNLPEIEAAVSAVVKMASGQPLTDADRLALGAAMEAAHQRVQAANYADRNVLPPSQAQ